MVRTKLNSVAVVFAIISVANHVTGDIEVGSMAGAVAMVAVMLDWVYVGLRKKGMKTFDWHECGWYDCCSGCWFITYELRDGDGVLLTAYDETEAKVMSLVLFCSEAECYREWLEENYKHAEEEFERVGCYEEEYLDTMLTKNGIVCNIIRDEEIDHDWDWRCTDD